MYEDNEGAIKIAKHPISNSNSKHIHVRLHFLRELVEQKEVEIIHVASQYYSSMLIFSQFVFHQDYVMGLR